MQSRRFPVFFEGSRIPVILSFLSPIEIGAITLGPFVFSRGTISPKTRNHEAIHWEQWKECGILLFPILYFAFWTVNLFKLKFDGKRAYREILFEREAYSNERNLKYIETRKKWSWARREQ